MTPEGIEADRTTATRHDRERPAESCQRRRGTAARRSCASYLEPAQRTPRTKRAFALCVTTHTRTSVRNAATGAFCSASTSPWGAWAPPRGRRSPARRIASGMGRQFVVAAADTHPAIRVGAARTSPLLTRAPAHRTSNGPRSNSGIVARRYAQICRRKRGRSRKISARRGRRESRTAPPVAPRGRSHHC
jgi:hypothetical protein